LVIGAHGAHALGVELALAPENALVTRAFRDGALVFENALAQSAAADGVLRRELGLASALALPLVGAEGPIGCIVLGYQQRKYGFSQELADDAALLGPIVAAALARATLFRRLERS